MLNNKIKITLLFNTFLLSACNLSDTASQVDDYYGSAKTVSQIGMVYTTQALVGAKVCIDKNDNKRCDADEKHAITNDQGEYAINGILQDEANKYVTIAFNDNSNDYISQSLLFSQSSISSSSALSSVLSAPAGEYNINYFSASVVQYMEAHSVDKDTAQSAIIAKINAVRTSNGKPDIQLDDLTDPDKFQQSEQDAILNSFQQCKDVLDSCLQTALDTTPPTFTSADSINVIEGTPRSTVLYTAVATDNLGTATTFTLGGTDATSFTLTDGALTFNSAPVYATKQTYTQRYSPMFVQKKY